jgi:nucleotide-binding universal stress UspA family protein
MSSAVSRILVPVDFSPHSEVALRYATALAGRLEGSLEILHVVEEPIAPRARGSETPIQDPSELRSKLIAEAERQLEQYRPITDSSRVRTVTTVRMGQPAHAITAYAQAGACDLIVMGTHGRSRLAHLVIGSVAAHVVRQAACPVLTLGEATMRDKGEFTFTPQSAAWRSALGHFGTSRE